MKVRMFDLRVKDKLLHRNLLSNFKKILKHGIFFFGPELHEFEKKMSKYLKVKYALGVASGSSALYIALKSLGIKKGDEVITTPFSWIITSNAIVECGATPVFCDIKDDYNINSGLIESKITKKTKAIVPVNLYGQSANYENIKKIAKKYNIKVIEDCAQSSGALYKNKPSGSYGDISAFSFYPTKNLGGYGDGGMIVTNNKKLFKKCLMLRKYGMSKLYYSNFHGINSRLDEIHAAILDYKLKKLDHNIKIRRNIARIYKDYLSGTDLILPNENKDNYHSYYVYVVRHKKRNEIMRFLNKNGIICNISYPYPIHSMKGYKKLTKSFNLNITNKMSKQIFSLPMYPELDNKKIDKVIKILKKF
mgnify:CR=1 FL=1